MIGRLPLLCLLAAVAVLAGCGETPNTPGTTETAYRVNWPQTRGGELFVRYCAACHGDRGQGDGYNVAALAVRPRDLSDAEHMAALSDDRLAVTVRDGGAGVGLSPLMPGFGDTVTPEELGFLVVYLRTLHQSP
ncbi:MAG: cytochrome c [Planctomycetes bacterium]|nr:cytochrome c [Planctomycetota bacterium]